MTPSILIVDDIRQNINYFKQILMQLGVHTELAESAEDGLKIVKSQVLDAIFLDYNMPGMDGFEFIAECRNIPEAVSIPIIMISTDMAINEIAVSKGLAQAWLVKRPTKAMVESTLKSLGVIGR